MKRIFLFSVLIVILSHKVIFSGDIINCKMSDWDITSKIMNG